MTAALLPDRHPVRDFFIEADALDVTPRSDMASMAHPIFSLATPPDMRVLRYDAPGTFLEIHPSTKGLATIFDKDILIFCISQLMHRRNRKLPVEQVVRITTHDLLVATNRPTGGINYKRLEQALDRLAGTRIKTNIKTGDEVSTQNFGLIDWYDYNRKGSRFTERLRYLDIKLSDFLYRAIQKAEVLAISRDYFRLRSPIDRRIYELARKHCGSQPSWRIGIDNLKQKCGSKQAMKHFAAHVRALESRNDLPDFTITFDGTQATFSRRQRAVVSATATVTAAAMIEAPTHPRRVRVSDKAIEELYEIAPRWDKHALENLYIQWAADKDVARNEDARFLKFVRRYTKGKPAP